MTGGCEPASCGWVRPLRKASAPARSIDKQKAILSYEPVIIFAHARPHPSQGGCGRCPKSPSQGASRVPSVRIGIGCRASWGKASGRDRAIHSSSEAGVLKLQALVGGMSDDRWSYVRRPWPVFFVGLAYPTSALPLRQCLIRQDHPSSPGGSVADQLVG
ncbi:hypothetical protein LZ32DRAFT_274360 [Colletotrichum eremochloae]|nr:hypothetical protein LZ32DRAFT_274360 [Colletotrichum eremochloae]